MRSFPLRPRSRKGWLILIGIGIGIAVFVVSANFMRSERKVEHAFDSSYGTADPQFVRTMGTLLGPALQGGNQITELINGDAIFPPMLAAIRGAQHTITFETYIYWSGDIGRKFAEAIAERARAGVRVLLLLDWFGSVPMDAELLQLLTESGCEIVRYHAPHWYHLTRLNNRTHRKLLVIDGRLGFTGGVGIGDVWTGNAQDPDHWRDTHFMVEGPVVARMQSIFMVNWIKARAVVEHTGDFFPPLAPAGTQLAQMFHSSPDEGSENIRLMFLLSIAAARDRILLVQSYFVPDDLTTRMLAAAARRGVEVVIILPNEHIDTPHVRAASRARWGPLFEAGIKIYEYQPTNLHSKIMIVDGLWTSVGSANFDNRSFRLNDEANLNIYDAEFATAMERTFAADRALSVQITLAAWRARPWTTKLTDWFSSLFRQQM